MSQTILVGVAHPFAFLEGAVAGIAFDEQDFLRGAESRHAPDRILDIAALVAAGNENAGGKFAVRKLPNRTPDQIGAQAQLPDAGQGRDEAVDERPEAEPAPRQQLALLAGR